MGCRRYKFRSNWISFVSIFGSTYMKALISRGLGFDLNSCCCRQRREYSF